MQRPGERISHDSKIRGARSSNTRPYTYENVSVKCLVERFESEKVFVYDGEACFALAWKNKSVNSGC